MPIVTPNEFDPAVDGRQSETAMAIRQGVIRGLYHADMTFVPELTLPSGRRTDLIGLDPKGKIVIVEIKSSIADFNSDAKWPEYKDFCDFFYFASHPSVPQNIFPDTEGFILADAHGCEVLREADALKLNPATRKSLTIRIARDAARKLQRMTDFYGETGLTRK